MEIFELKEGIKVHYIKSKAFPDGVKESHDKIHSLVPYSHDRNYFGISYMQQDGSIIYKAAAEELIKGELSKHNLNDFLIEKGNYISIMIYNFIDNLPEFLPTFQTLMAHPNIDPKGACIEWYLKDKDCRCMVKLV